MFPFIIKHSRIGNRNETNYCIMGVHIIFRRVCEYVEEGTFPDAIKQ